MRNVNTDLNYSHEDGRQVSSRSKISGRLSASEDVRWDRHFIQASKVNAQLTLNTAFQSVMFDSIDISNGITTPTTASYGISRSALYMVSYTLCISGSAASSTSMRVRVRNTGSDIRQSAASIMLNGGNISSGSLTKVFLEYFLSGANIEVVAAASATGSIGVLDAADERTSLMILEV